MNGKFKIIGNEICNLYIFNCNQMILQSSVTTCPKKVTQQKISLFNILTCLLCSNKAKTAHICPNCSKFFCEQCIKKWIESGNQYCPNCKNYLNQTSIVNCNKLSQDLSNALQALIQLQTPQQCTCEQHSIQKTYFCQNCKHAICSDCIVLQSSHRGHNVLKLKKIKMDFNQQILSILSKIRKCVKQIQKIKQQTTLLKNSQGQQLKMKMQKINILMQRIKNNYECKINDITSKFQNILDGNKLMQASAQKIFQQFQSQVKQMSKINLVKRQESQFQSILLSSMQEIGNNYLQKDLIKNTVQSSQMCTLLKPKFAQKTFVLYNYTQFRDKKDVIYSDAFFDGPLQWRLKIYPNGLQKKNNFSNKQIKFVNQTNNCTQEYISIYIELVSGVRQGGRYQFNIEIINQTDPSKIISQIYQADFDDGKCWGYDQFANILTLYQKGYVHQQQDSLKISVSVGPPSYFYATLDQQAIINRKQETLWRNASRINQMKNELLLKQSKKSSSILFQKQKQKQNPEFERIDIKPIINNQRVLEQIQDIKTPRTRILNLQLQKQIKNTKNRFEQTINFENFIIQPPKQEITRHNQQFDYQSAQLRKIYRRVSHMNQRNNLLMF